MSPGETESTRPYARPARPHRAGRKFPLDHRLQLITRFHDELGRRGDEFVALLTEEGHPRRFAEIELEGVTAASSPSSVDFYRRQMLQEISTPDRLLRLVRKPDGVVGLNPPQNAAAINSAVGVAVLGCREQRGAACAAEFAGLHVLPVP